MVSIVTKKIKGREYLYLVTSMRKDGKVKQKTIKYIGPKRPIPKEEFDCMELSYEDKDWVLKGQNDELSYTKHTKMRQVSDQYMKYLASLDPASQEKEQQKFLSRFIASSNAIEGSTLTVNDTFNFLFNEVIPKGHSKKELFMAQNLFDAWKYLERNHTKFPNKQDILELHSRVNKGIESDETLGQYKKVQNYIGEVYTSSHLFVEEKMKRLFKWIKEAYKKVDDFEVAFQSHSQFEIIHPFVDGNGRVGRLLINWLLMRKKLAPLAIRDAKRNEYIAALENTRRGKIQAISKFCYKEYVNQYKFV